MNTPARLRAIIADDEAPARNRMRELLDDCADTITIDIVGDAANGHELLARLQETPADLVFLDIRMPGMDGLETARHLQRLEAPPRVVFTTAYDTYAIQAFDLHALDYLLKPIRVSRLRDCLKRVQETLAPKREAIDAAARGPRTHLAVHERGRVVLVPVRDIRFLRAELKYVTIRTGEREYLIEESLSKLEQEFAGTFVRVHRNSLVALAHLTGFEKGGDETAETHWVAVLRDIPERLPVSRRQSHVVREFFKGTA